MARSLITFRHNVIPLPAGGDTVLKNAIQNIETNMTGGPFETSLSWPANSGRLNYCSWTTRMAWDTTNKRIISYMKQAGGNDGALHYYDAATNLWEQVWRGYVQGGSGSLGHPYASWAYNDVDQTVWMIPWNGSMYRYQGVSNTSSNWELMFTPNNSSSQTPNGLGFIADWYGAGQTGVIHVTRNTGRGRIAVMKEDGSSYTDLFIGTTGTGGTEVMYFYEPTTIQMPYYNGVLVGASAGWPKVAGSSYTNTNPRSVDRVQPLWLITGNSTNPSVIRLPDMPSIRVSWTNQGVIGDKLAAYGNYVYLFGKDDRSIWRLNVDATAAGWSLLPEQHVFDPGLYHQNVLVCPIEEYGGIVAMINNSVGTSDNTAYSPSVFVHKITTIGTDTVPNAFSFTDETGVALSTQKLSAPITVSGLTNGLTTTITASGSTGYGYTKNSPVFADKTQAAGTVQNGDLIRACITSSGSYNTALTSTVTIGGVSDTYTVTTVSASTTPAAFSFVDEIDVARSSTKTSAPITITGNAAAATVTVSGGTYQKNGTGGFVSSTGSALAGDTFEVQVATSASYSTATSVTLTVGGVSDTYTVTTIADASSNYWNFSTNTLVGWTSLNTSGSDWAYATVSGATGATGTYVCRETAGASGTRWHGLAYDALGTVDGDLQTVDILYRWKTRSGENAPQRAPVGIFMNATDGVSYGVRFPTTTSMSVIRLSASGSTSTTLGGVAVTAVAADTWYWGRFRREISGVFKVKHWTGVVGDEPGTWDITSTASTTVTSGLVGIAGYAYTEEKDIDIISFSLGGTAPSS